MTLAVEFDPDSIKVKQHCKYIGQRSFYSKILAWTQTHTHRTDCGTWTTKVVRN